MYVEILKSQNIKKNAQNSEMKEIDFNSVTIDHFNP